MNCLNNKTKLEIENIVWLILSLYIFMNFRKIVCFLSENIKCHSFIQVWQIKKNRTFLWSLYISWLFLETKILIRKRTLFRTETEKKKRQRFKNVQELFIKHENGISSKFKIELSLFPLNLNWFLMCFLLQNSTELI